MPRLRGTKVRSERATIEQFRPQHFQPCDVVDVIPRWQNMHGQLQFGGTLERLLRYAFRAPGNVLKQTVALRLQPEQIVAAVKGGSEHRAVAGLRKDASGLDQKRGGQRGAVGIEDHREAMAALQELRKRVIEAFTESRIARLDQGNLARQIFLEEGPRVSRTVRNVAGDRDLRGGGENVIGDIAQECRVALRRFFKR